jgi:hypothetical protein
MREKNDVSHYPNSFAFYLFDKFQWARSALFLFLVTSEVSIGSSGLKTETFSLRLNSITLPQWHINY